MKLRWNPSCLSAGSKVPFLKKLMPRRKRLRKTRRHFSKLEELSFQTKKSKNAVTSELPRYLPLTRQTRKILTTLFRSRNSILGGMKSESISPTSRTMFAKEPCLTASREGGGPRGILLTGTNRSFPPRAPQPRV